MAWWTKSTKRQRGTVKSGEAKAAGRMTLRAQDQNEIEEGLDDSNDEE